MRIFRKHLAKLPTTEMLLPAPQGHRRIDTHAAFRAWEARQFWAACGCPHFAEGTRQTPCLWHRSYCLWSVPDDIVPPLPQMCTLVWHGRCHLGLWPPTESAAEEEQEP